jgi:putative oxidoreductase
MTREKLIDITLFLLRAAVALVFIQVGGLKLFGWFGGMPEGMVLTPLIMIAGWLEIIGGIAILAGIFTRPVAFILAGEMAVAYFMGHFPMGFFPIQNQGESAVLLCFIFLFLAAYGAGRWSVDAVLRRKSMRPAAVL